MGVLRSALAIFRIALASAAGREKLKHFGVITTMRPLAFLVSHKRIVRATRSRWPTGIFSSSPFRHP